MTKPNTGELDPEGEGRNELRSYIIGLATSALLTGAAFAAVLGKLDRPIAIIVIVVAALLQVTVHLRHFLHLSFTGRQAREDLLLVLFSTILLAIMAGGTIWILSDLQGRMHPSHAAQQTGAMPQPAAPGNR